MDDQVSAARDAQLDQASLELGERHGAQRTRGVASPAADARAELGDEADTVTAGYLDRGGDVRDQVHGAVGLLVTGTWASPGSTVIGADSPPGARRPLPASSAASQSLMSRSQLHSRFTYGRP